MMYAHGQVALQKNINKTLIVDKKKIGELTEEGGEEGCNYDRAEMPNSMIKFRRER